MILMIKKILKKFQNRFWLNKSEKRLIQFFQEKKKKIKSDKIALISAQLDDDYFLIKNFFIGQYLSDYKGLNLTYFINFHNLRSNISLLNKFKSIFVYNFLGFLKIKKKYDSFCNEYFFNFHYIKPRKNFYDELKVAKLNINQILDYEYKKIKIGDLCVDTYLQTFHKFLFDKNLDDIKNDPKFKITFNTACQIIDNFFDYFESKNISCYITNYSGYLDHGLGLRVANYYKCKIYITGDLDKAFIINNNIYHKYDYEKNLDYFEKLSDKESKIKLAENFLKKRFKGEKDNAISYLSFVPYKTTKEKINNIDHKKSICIFSHCTADSLYGFKEIKFFTQKIWLEETLNHLKKKNFQNEFNIFFKIHPNETKEGEIYLKKLVKVYSFLKILDKNVNINKIINSNLIAGITMHGTIGLELAYNGIKTIYAHSNPYIKFNFCIYSSSKQNYFYDLENVKFLQKSKIHKREAAIFYFMNYFFSPLEELKDLEILEIKKLFYGQKNYDYNYILEFLKNMDLENKLKKLDILDKCFEDRIV
jgi:hypothetical protein